MLERKKVKDLDGHKTYTQAYDNNKKVNLTLFWGKIWSVLIIIQGGLKLHNVITHLLDLGL